MSDPEIKVLTAYVERERERPDPQKQKIWQTLRCLKEQTLSSR